ncbi:hypothetical protein BJY24_000157 [Nocardia transvalensis]|uniref:Ig-like domain-containing protein n=1 Tax=Nocardia transvalensis TaxID=37333 RepID=A0A7W9P8G6_9NOCA|nr:hypothetical protein [Nocardia transvalensis]MBB5911290.1 hypothetical protein [Nocardia transvalensis]
MSYRAVRTAGLVLGSAGIVLLGTASASASTRLDVNGQAVQGCKTTVTATTSSSNPMHMDFYDDEIYLGRVQVTNQDGKMRADVDWTPGTTGDHVITARAVGSYIAPEDQVSTLYVRVSTGTDLGSSCVPMPLG